MVRGQLDTVLRHLRRITEQREAGVSDAHLLECFVSRADQAAFELLLWRHGPLVLSVCRRVLRHAQDAEDAFQATFLALVRKAGSIGKGESVAGWLYKVAYRVALRARAAAVRRGGVAPAVEPVAPSDDLLWRDLRPVLDDEVNRLPEKYRLPVVLCYFQGKSHEEAARQLGCATATVAVRLLRARERLRGRLTRRGLALSGAALALALEGKAAAAALVAPALVHVTLTTVQLFQTGSAGAVSGTVTALTEGVLQAMWTTKLKTVAAVLFVAVAVSTLGTGMLIGRVHKPDPNAAKSEEGTATEAAREEEKPKELVEVPAEREGKLMFVGTEFKPGEKVPEGKELEKLLRQRKVFKVAFPFLVVEVGANEKVEPREIVKVDEEPAKKFRRWREREEFRGGQVHVLMETRYVRKLEVGDTVREGDLLALVNPDLAVDELLVRTTALRAADSDLKVAIKTKDEANRRYTAYQSAESKRPGTVSKDDLEGAYLTWQRHVQEQFSKEASLAKAHCELRAAWTQFKMHQVRCIVPGVIKRIVRRQGEAVRVHDTILVIRSDEDGRGAPDKGDRMGRVRVPAERDGVLVLVGTEIKEGEKVVKAQILTVLVEGKPLLYRRLKVGETVEKGQLLARVDDRLARIEVAIRRSQVTAAEAALRSVSATAQEADRRYNAYLDLNRKGGFAASKEDIEAARLARERYVEEEKAQKARVGKAQQELRQAQTVLAMHEVRSPVRGIVRRLSKRQGEAVRNLETVLEIEETAEK
jgi:RNA polymerase sigma factor (sigma-70 family)